MGTNTILLYVSVLALVALLPMVLDIFMAYRSRDKTRNLLVEKAAADKLQLSELKELLKEVGISPPGIPGLARATMALTVIVVLGIAVVHILVGSSSDKDSQIVNNILSMLAGLLSAITGFYFGGKSEKEKASAKSNTA